MAFCEQCGTQLGEGAAFCAGCGKEASAGASEGMRERASRQVFAASTAASIDDVSGYPEKWRQRFAVIEKAGGERVRWWRWPEGKQLTGKEKRLITSNLWAFVFGPFYYLYLGMWRKAITLSLLALVIDAILGVAGDALGVSVDRFLWVVSAIIFRQCANVDYYRKTVLKRREWL
ncbi:integron [Burkholderia pseudomallei]|nr:integron [Burkholderia pseudomallei]CAJ7903868.1 integron [Burkholderia pseudomallei]CAJ9606036.1 integron [Burkholderia pseudomallei]